MEGGEEGEAEGGDSEHGNNWAGCSVWSSWGKGLNESISHYVGIYGHFQCKARVEGFEIQLALQRYDDGHWVTETSFDPNPFEPSLDNATHDFKEAGGVDKGSFQGPEWKCLPGERYRAWYWGRYWSKGKTVWYAYGIEKRYWKCSVIPYG